jgi:signal recognition particle receptor subunit beta
MVSLNTETDRTLFFDLLPMDVGVIGGFKAKLQLYTVPGQVFYNSTRKLVLKGVDGIVFVADSQTAMLDANRESIQNLTENLRELGLDLGDIPMVFQWNKRDLKQIVSLELLERELNPRHLTSFPAIARDGAGVFETLRGISRLALTQIRRQQLGEREAQPAAPPPAPPPAPAPAPVKAAAPVPPTPPVPLMPWELTSEPQPGEAEAGPEDARAASALTPGSLPEALSFLDFPASMELFEPPAAAPARVAEPPAPVPAPEDTPKPADGPVKIMAPLVVKLLPPQQSRSAAAATGTSPMPRLALRPLGALPAPRGSAGRATHPGSQGAAGRMAPALQVLLPPETDDGELEVQILVRRNGLIVAKATTPLAGPGPGGSETVAIEFKRS